MSTALHGAVAGKRTNVPIAIGGPMWGGVVVANNVDRFVALLTT
jgi:hypothetical protein